jgi:hypothetical protein
MKPFFNFDQFSTKLNEKHELIKKSAIRRIASIILVKAKFQNTWSPAPACPA